MDENWRDKWTLPPRWIYVHEIYHMDEKKLWINYSIGDIEIWIMKGVTWITFMVENENHL